MTGMTLMVALGIGVVVGVLGVTLFWMWQEARHPVTAGAAGGTAMRPPLAGLWSFVGQWWQQIAITQAGIYLVASFGQGHDILPTPAAWALAIGMEGTYLRGLIDMGRVRGAGRAWGTALIGSTYVTIILWGIAHILSLPSVGVIPERELGAGWGGFIAAIHVLPVAFTGLCSAMLHRAHTAEEAQRAAEEEERARARAQLLLEQRDQEEAEERAARRRLELEAAERRRQLELEAEEQRLKLQLWEAGQESKRRLRLAANSERQEAPSASGTATNSPANSPANSAANTDREQRREQRREQVVARLAADPNTNRAQLARELGIGRTLLYELIRDAQQRGELPQQGE